MAVANEHRSLVFKGEVNQPWWSMEVSNAGGDPLAPGEVVVFKPSTISVPLVGKELGGATVPSLAGYRVAGVVWPHTIDSLGRGYVVAGGLISGVAAIGQFNKGDLMHLSPSNLGKLQKTTLTGGSSASAGAAAFAIAYSQNTLSVAISITALILPWRF